MNRRTPLIIATAAVGALTLTSCDEYRHMIAEDNQNWELIDTVELAAIDSSAGVYVEGSFSVTLGSGSGEIESEQAIDYKYAEVVNDEGGMQQRMLSNHHENVAPVPDGFLEAEEAFEEGTPIRAPRGDGEYPGADAVTIYQTPDEDNPRIETYYCAADDIEAEQETYTDRPGIFAFMRESTQTPRSWGCEGYQPDGEDHVLIRHEIHVPEGAVVESFDAPDTGVDTE